MELFRRQTISRPLVALTLIGHLVVFSWSIVTPLSSAAAGPYAQWLRSQLRDAPDESFEQALLAAASGPVSSLAVFVDAFVDAYAAERPEDVGGAFGAAVLDAEALRAYLKDRFRGLSGVAVIPRQPLIAGASAAVTLVLAAGVEVVLSVARHAATPLADNDLSAAAVIRLLFGAAQPLGP